MASDHLLFTLDHAGADEILADGEYLRTGGHIYRIRISHSPGALAQVRGELIEAPTDEVVALADANPTSEPGA